MSFIEPKKTVIEGDTVLLYISINNMHPIKVTPNIVNKNGETVSQKGISSNNSNYF